MSYNLRFQETKEEIQGVMNLKKIHLHLESLKNYDSETYEHSLRVALLSVDLAKENKIRNKIVNKIAKAALLHDLGKIQIPKEIINKNSKLSKEEKAIILQHPRIGAEKAKDIGKCTSILVLCHHEFQRNGYPRSKEKSKRVAKIFKERRKNNCKAKELCQIIAIADMYDALKSSRPYKEENNKEKLNAILKSQYTGNKNYINQILKR